MRANNSLVALKRLSKSESSIKENSLKLEGLIKELSDDKDNNFKIIKVNSKDEKMIRHAYKLTFLIFCFLVFKVVYQFSKI